MSDYEYIHKQVGDYYSARLQEHGASHWGVDWNSTESQELRFVQLLKIVRSPAEHFSINDVGCGYGALYGFLARLGYGFDYTGFDIATNMIDKAQELYAQAQTPCTFVSDRERLAPADYTVASGIFNVQMQIDREEWKRYMLATLDFMWSLSTSGMSFNVLTGYSDAEYMREGLYYADPLFLFDHCKRQYSRHVALLHDYGLYEFTILVRRIP
jgi:SAM-dependent methyltransferase